MHVMEDDGRTSSGAENGGDIHLPPPDYDDTSLNSDSRIVENGGKVSEPFNVSEAYKHNENPFQTNNTDQRATAHDLLHDITLKSPETISRDTMSTQNLSKPWHGNGSNALKDGGGKYFHTTKRQNTDGPEEVQSLQTVASISFYHSKAAEADLLQAGSSKSDKPSYDTLDKKRDIFDPFKIHLDPFSTSSVTSVDPFPSPLSRNLFNTSSLDDPFSPSPSMQTDHFKDVSNVTSDIFQTQFLEAKETSKSMFSTPLINSPSDVNFSTPASTDLKKPPKPLPPYRPKRSNTQTELVLMTPQGSQQDLLQSTLFSESNSLSASPSLSPVDVPPVRNGSHMSGQKNMKTFFYAIWFILYTNFHIITCPGVEF